MGEHGGARRPLHKSLCLGGFVRRLLGLRREYGAARGGGVLCGITRAVEEIEIFLKIYGGGEAFARLPRFFVIAVIYAVTP